MRINKYNCEGYQDPVVYEALSKIEAEERVIRGIPYHPLIYICSSHENEQKKCLEKEKLYIRYALMNQFIPFSPYLFILECLDAEGEKDLWMKTKLVFLGKCEQVWVIGNVITEEMAVEIRKAKQKKIKIRFFTKDMEEKSEYENCIWKKEEKGK